MLCAFLSTLALLVASAGGATAARDRDRDPKTPIPDQPAVDLDARARDHATTARLDELEQRLEAVQTTRRARDAQGHDPSVGCSTRRLDPARLGALRLAARARGLEDRALLVSPFPRIRERPERASSGPILPGLEVFMTFCFERYAIASVVSAVS